MSKRMIRLKEHEANLDTLKSATARNVEIADGSIPPGPYVLRTDSNGFIETGNRVDADVPDLIMLGGSFVESMYANEDQRFASQVERGLSAIGRPYRVRNAGYSGMTSLHLLGVLTTKLPPLMKPDSKLLLFIGQSDVNALLAPGLYWEQSKTVTPFTTPVTPSAVMSDNWQEAFVRMVTTTITFAKLQGYDVAITAGVFRDGDFSHDGVLRRTFKRNRDMYERVSEMRRFIVTKVREIAAEHSLPLFDSAATFLTRPDYFYDELHLNHDGQREYARALTTWINEYWSGRP